IVCATFHDKGSLNVGMVGLRVLPRRELLYSAAEAKVGPRARTTLCAGGSRSELGQSNTTRRSGSGNGTPDMMSIRADQAPPFDTDAADPRDEIVRLELRLHPLPDPLEPFPP